MELTFHIIVIHTQSISSNHPDVLEPFEIQFHISPRWFSMVLLRRHDIYNYLTRQRHLPNSQIPSPKESIVRQYIINSIHMVSSNFYMNNWGLSYILYTRNTMPRIFQSLFYSITLTLSSLKIIPRYSLSVKSYLLLSFKLFSDNSSLFIRT